MLKSSSIATFAQAEERWKRQGLYYTSVSIGILLAIFAGMSFSGGDYTTGWIVLAGTFVTTATMLICRIEPMPVWAHFPILLYLLGLLSFMLLINFQQSSPLMWLFSGPAICMFCFGARTGVIISFFLLLIIITTLAVNDHILTQAYSIRFICSFILLSSVCYAYEHNREKATLLLSEAKERIETLEGLLPMCAWCKNIRNTEGDWEDMETYIKRSVSINISHGICPSCSKKLT
ncbi:MAG: hypothetical protein RKH07_01310 [Gammaproteobacteria bacterium]